MNAPTVTDFMPEIERLAESVPADEIPALLGALERIRARLWQRLNEAPTPSSATPKRDQRAADRLLTTREAAQLLGVKPRWLYSHAHEIPGVQRLSRRCLRFSERKLRRWMDQRSP